MTNTHAHTMTLLVTCGILLAGMLFMSVPRGADAAQLTSRLGGGNALLHASIALSLGLPHTSSASGNSGNSIGNSASSNPEGQQAAYGAGGASNGGATAGNGGNGGDGGGASVGGLVRAGNVVSNSNALNAINVTIVRISIGR